MQQYGMYGSYIQGGCVHRAAVCKTGEYEHVAVCIPLLSGEDQWLDSHEREHMQ